MPGASFTEYTTMCYALPGCSPICYHRDYTIYTETICDKLEIGRNSSGASFLAAGSGEESCGVTRTLYGVFSCQADARAARPRSPVLFCCVGNARSAFPTQQNIMFAQRSCANAWREKVKTLSIRHALRKRHCVAQRKENAIIKSILWQTSNIST